MMIQEVFKNVFCNNLFNSIVMKMTKSVIESDTSVSNKKFEIYSLA